MSDQRCKYVEHKTGLKSKVRALVIHMGARCPPRMKIIKHFLPIIRYNSEWRWKANDRTNSDCE